MSQIVRYHELAEKLDCSTAVIRKHWKKLPHFFVSSGRDLRSARFDVEEVLHFLKNTDNVLREEGEAD